MEDNYNNILNEVSKLIKEENKSSSKKSFSLNFISTKQSYLLLFILPFLFIFFGLIFSKPGFITNKDRININLHNDKSLKNNISYKKLFTYSLIFGSIISVTLYFVMVKKK